MKLLKRTKQLDSALLTHLREAVLHTVFTLSLLGVLLQFETF